MSGNGRGNGGGNGGAGAPGKPMHGPFIDFGSVAGACAAAGARLPIPAVLGFLLPKPRTVVEVAEKYRVGWWHADIVLRGAGELVAYVGNGRFDLTDRGRVAARAITDVVAASSESGRRAAEERHRRAGYEPEPKDAFQERERERAITPERVSKGDLVETDERGPGLETVRHMKSRGTLVMMHAKGSITDRQLAAGVRIAQMYWAAQFADVRAANLEREVGLGRGVHDRSRHAIDEGNRLYGIVGLFGGWQSPAGSLVYHVLAREETIGEWCSQRAVGSWKPSAQAAGGMIIQALAAIVVHLDKTSGWGAITPPADCNRRSGNPKASLVCKPADR